MNKRVQELVIATDAWCDQNLPSNWTDRVDEYLPVWNAKFAELIVRECAKLADEPTSRPYESYGEKIKNHFGVE